MCRHGPGRGTCRNCRSDRDPDDSRSNAPHPSASSAAAATTGTKEEGGIRGGDVNVKLERPSSGESSEPDDLNDARGTTGRRSGHRSRRSRSGASASQNRDDAANADAECIQGILLSPSVCNPDQQDKFVFVETK